MVGQENLAPQFEDDSAKQTWEQYVVWAYRLLLGREPESSAVLNECPYNNRRELVRAFVASPEFVSNNGFGLPSDVKLAAHDGYKIYAPREDELIGSPVLHGSYEPHVTSVFRRYLKPGMNVIDIGANIGHFSMLAASIVGPDGMVTSVEPNLENARLLEASRRLNGFDHVRLVCAAASRDAGMLLLKPDVSNGTTAPVKSTDELWVSRLVPCIPLGTVLPPGRAVDFIKIDIEGAEYQALYGCGEVLRRDAPVIVSELSPAALLENSGVTAEDYMEFLLSCKLELAVIGDDGVLIWFGGDVRGVMNAWSKTNSDHIDIVAAPSHVKHLL